MDKKIINDPRSHLCFPLYIASKEVIRIYQPYLDKLNLTYTQYIVMMVLWEKYPISSKELGERLFLDCGTLTPLLRKLESKGFIKKYKDSNDKRNLIVELTPKGKNLEKEAVKFPEVLVDENSKLTPQELKSLSSILNKIISTITK